MRRSGLEIKSIVVVLIVVNVVIFIATRFTGPFFSSVSDSIFIKLFALWPDRIVKYGWVWQLGTYMFLHGSELHLFFNMYALYLFGRALEEKWGWRRFIAYYLVTGVGAGIATFLWNLAHGSFIPTVGASGAIFGVLLAFGFEFPDVVLLLFFVIPMRARLAVFIWGGLELLFLLTGVMQRVGHFTHLAGLLFGYLYYLIGIRSGAGGSRFRRLGKPRRPGVGGPGGASFMKGRGQIGARSRNAVSRDIELAVALREKISNALPLSRSDTAFLMMLKRAFDGHGGGVCDPSEFDLTAESCRSCEDVHACLYRFLIGRGRPP